MKRIRITRLNKNMWYKTPRHVGTTYEYIKVWREYFLVKEIGSGERLIKIGDGVWV